MQSLMDIVACIEVTAEHSNEVFANKFLHHRPATSMMVLIVTNSWGTRCPNVAILSVFSPSRLIHLQSRAGSDLRFEHIETRLHLFFQPMLEVNNRSITDRDSMHRLQVQLDL